MGRSISMTLLAVASCVSTTLPAADLFLGTRAIAARFYGLWEGIDSEDGSGMQRSITQGPNGTLRIVGRETFFSYCQGEPGIILGTGVIKRSRVHADDQLLRCANDSEVDTSAVYELNFTDGTLIETPNNPTVEPFVYHKISRGR